MRILFVTYGLPWPPRSGVRIRDFNLIKYLSRHHSILLLSLLEFPEEVEQLVQLSPYCEMVDAVIARRLGLREGVVAVGRTMRARRPLATQGFYSEELAARIQAVVASRNVDVVQIEHSFLAPYVDVLPEGTRYKKVLSFHNVGFQQYRRMTRLRLGFADRLGFAVKALLMRGWEVAHAEKFDHCIVVSPAERHVLQAAGLTRPISVIHNGVDTELYRPLPEARSGNVLLFVGTMGYAPNVDAVLYFHRAIMPLIRRRVPDVELIVVGAHPRPQIRKLAMHSDVTVTGKVPDVVPYYERSRVSIVPLRAGGGTRLKILESMALGRPVVSTSIGCEGLDVVNQVDLLIADAPAAFAEGVVRLLLDRELRARIARHGRQVVERRYDWSAVSNRLATIYRDLGASRDADTGAVTTA
jgi:polysaccharide biosynthesis protein PslH